MKLKISAILRSMLLATVVMLGNTVFATIAIEVRVTDLRTEQLVDPMSIDTPTPRLGWRIEAARNDVRQVRYRLIVSSTRENAERMKGDLWDTTVDSDQSQWVRYAGKPLRSNTRCYWRVQVTTKECITRWSDIAMWNVGLLTESDWSGRWIGLPQAMPWDEEVEHSHLSARYLRKTFDTDKPVRQATLYICGLGMYEAYINGERVGDDVLAPAPTDYRRTVLYNAYDVTAMLQKENAIGVVLGNGRFYTMQQNKKPYKITNFGYPTLRANLIIEYADGTKQTIATDEKWRMTADGAIRSNNEYDGEVYDARKALGDWTRTGYDDSGWMKAERTAIPMGTLRGAMAPNMKVLKKMLRLYAKSPLVTDENRTMLLIRMGRYYYFGYRTVCLLLRSAEHYHLLKSVERTAKKWCPDVYEEAGRQSLKIRLMRRFGGLFYCAAAGRESLWAK